MPKMKGEKPRTRTGEPIRAAYISERGRLELNTRRARLQGAPIREEQNYYVCQSCGQAVDMRLLGDVLYHDQEDHKPLRTS
jgi:hypothetical protein